MEFALFAVPSGGSEVGFDQIVNGVDVVDGTVRLLDDAAILACAAYVDLNPIRAAMAQTLEDRDFTSVQKRIQAIRAGVDNKVDRSASGGSQASGLTPAYGATDPSRAVLSPSDSAKADSHLAELSIDEMHDPIGPCCYVGAQRTSDKGFLPMTTAAYVDLLDWTARQLRADKRGATPAGMQAVFERLGISGEVW